MRDAIILEAHVGERRDVFVTTDAKHFINHGQTALEALCTTADHDSRRIHRVVHRVERIVSDFAIVLAILGLTLALLGSALSSRYQDPDKGDHLMLESFDPERAKRLRRGLLLQVIGVGCQIVALVIALLV